MSTSNLWGDLPEAVIARNPLQILKEQASELTKMTKGVLMGIVEGPLPYGSGTFAFELSIRAPALNDYSITVLRIEYNLHMYPLTLTDILKPKQHECNDESTYLSELKNILQSSGMRKVISSLLVQSNTLAAT